MSKLNLPNDTLILIATGDHAKLYRSADHTLQLRTEWTPGDLADQGPSGKSPPEQSDKESMEATFSKIMANKLYEMAHDGDFTRLVLCADPGTLGEMRPLLHKEVSDKILVEVDKTLINSSISDIESTLSKAMPK